MAEQQSNNTAARRQQAAAPDPDGKSKRKAKIQLGKNPQDGDEENPGGMPKRMAQQRVGGWSAFTWVTQRAVEVQTAKSTLAVGGGPETWTWLEDEGAAEDWPVLGQ